MIENDFCEWWQAHGTREACELAWVAAARASEDETERRLKSVLVNLGKVCGLAFEIDASERDLLPHEIEAYRAAWKAKFTVPLADHLSIDETVPPERRLEFIVGAVQGLIRSEFPNLSLGKDTE